MDGRRVGKEGGPGSWREKLPYLEKGEHPPNSRSGEEEEEGEGKREGKALLRWSFNARSNSSGVWRALHPPPPKKKKAQPHSV